MDFDSPHSDYIHHERVSPQTAGLKSASHQRVRSNKNASSLTNVYQKKAILLGLLMLVIAGAGNFAYTFALRMSPQREVEVFQMAPEGQLTCMPIDDQGNITNDKYRYHRIKVINKTGGNRQVWVQWNTCSPSEVITGADGSKECRVFERREPHIVGPGEVNARTFEINVTCEKTGQLDVAADDGGSPCFNTVDNQPWQGGIAFTVKTNSTSCTSQVACNQACDATHLCSDGTKCIGGVCRNQACDIETDCICNTSVTCNQTCDANHICPSGTTCQSGKCRNSSCPAEPTCQCPVATPLTCINLAPSKQQPQRGDTVTYTCSGEGTNARYANFRLLKNDQPVDQAVSYVALDSNKVATWSYTLPQSMQEGTYKVQCRICEGTVTSSPCTTWSQAH